MLDESIVLSKILFHRVLLYVFIRKKTPNVMEKCSESSSADLSKTCDIVWSN